MDTSFPIQLAKPKVNLVKQDPLAWQRDVSSSSKDLEARDFCSGNGHPYAQKREGTIELEFIEFSTNAFQGELQLSR